MDAARVGAAPQAGAAAQPGIHGQQHRNGHHGEPVVSRPPGYHPSGTRDFTPWRSDPFATTHRHAASPLEVAAGVAAGLTGGLATGALAGRSGPALLTRMDRVTGGGGPLGMRVLLAGGALAGAALGGFGASRALASTEMHPGPERRGRAAAQRPSSNATGTEALRDIPNGLRPPAQARTSSSYTPKAGDILPDVTPIAPKTMNVYEDNGKRFLEFSSTLINVGQGPLEIAFNPRTFGDVKQRVLTRQGERREVASNATMTKDDRDTHQHTHLNDFARYSLYKAKPDGTADRLVAEHHKVSFLITDTDSPLSAMDPNGHRRRSSIASAGRVVQGMSSGSGDTYGSGLEGQQFDISGVAPGKYVLRVTFDPNDRLAEANETNNQFDTVVTLRANGEGVPAADPLGPPRLPARPGVARTDGAEGG